MEPSAPVTYFAGTYDPSSAGKPRLVIPQPEPMYGCWVVSCFDWNEIFKAVFAEEVEARRYAMANHYDVRFVKWGEET